MAQTAAERMRKSRSKRNSATAESATDVTKSERNTTSATEPTYADVLAPLDVYSPARWAYLQSRGHKWDADRQRSFRPAGVVGVPVPGDPAYQGVADGVRPAPAGITV